MMSCITLNSSIPTLNTSTSFLALNHATNTQPECAWANKITPIEFQPLTKSFSYVIGEQAVKFPLVKIALNVASFFYSKLPTLSLPLAAASPTVFRDTSALCSNPIGSYEKSCHHPKITYLPEKNTCLMETDCATIYESIPHKKASFRFTPDALKVDLVNRNGTLDVNPSNKEEVAATHEQKMTAQQNVQSKATFKLKFLQEKQHGTTNILNAGDVISFDSQLGLNVINPEIWKKRSSEFEVIQKIAQSTGGLVSDVQSPDSLIPLMETIVAHILKGAESSQSINIAFVIDSTICMDLYIKEMQKNIVPILKQLQEQSHKNCHIAIMGYSNKIINLNADFTSDPVELQKTIDGFTVDGSLGGADTFLEVLLEAKNDLCWHPEAKRIVFLIGDAILSFRTENWPDCETDETVVISEYQSEESPIAVYPFFTGDSIDHTHAYGAEGLAKIFKVIFGLGK